jgi:hypothetical protein
MVLPGRFKGSALWLIFFMGHHKSGISMLSLQRMLEIREPKTVWRMAHRTLLSY